MARGRARARATRANGVRSTPEKRARRDGKGKNHHNAMRRRRGNGHGKGARTTRRLGEERRRRREPPADRPRRARRHTSAPIGVSIQQKLIPLTPRTRDRSSRLGRRARRALPLTNFLRPDAEDAASRHGNHPRGVALRRAPIDRPPLLTKVVTFETLHHARARASIARFLAHVALARSSRVARSRARRRPPLRARARAERRIRVCRSIDKRARGRSRARAEVHRGDARGSVARAARARDQPRGATTECIAIRARGMTI